MFPFRRWRNLSEPNTRNGDPVAAAAVYRRKGEQRCNIRWRPVSASKPECPELDVNHYNTEPTTASAGRGRCKGQREPPRKPQKWGRDAEAAGRPLTAQPIGG